MPSNGEDLLEESRETDQTLGRLASIGQISAGIAHEVKNPLTSVKGFLQLLQEEQQHSFLDMAASELDRALDTLENLLHVSKPDLDNEAYTSIHVCAELESIIYLFQDQLYRVQVKTDFENTNEIILGQRNQLKKAFFNLLKNAFEAIAEEGQIIIGHRRIGNRILVTIEDSGAGVPEEKMEMLGTPFYTTKENGTGMGLAQVFSTIYQHGATIDVESYEGRGTKFMIQFPVVLNGEIEPRELDLPYEEGQSFEQYLEANREQFKSLLLQEAMTIFQRVEEAETLDQEDLLSTATSLKRYVIQGLQHEVIVMAKSHGRNWAKNGLPLILKLEWIQSFRKVFSDFAYTFYKRTSPELDSVLKMERQTTYILDHFINHYIASFTEYNKDVLRSHRELIDELSVPVILLTPSLGVLPIVGTIDTYRAKQIQERVLAQIESLKISRMIVDLSGVAYMDTAVVSHLFQIIEGLALLGCEAVVTGIRSEIANTIIDLGVRLTDKIHIQGTLQQALDKFGLKVTYTNDI
ncbi:ATP-binding protein [Ammoniphilus oxalaticus]|uniref:ATP-binding protein n=1 Tax=Ammoniphilus oxalaticus TaxID=66863 RepID=UPI0014745B30|nr:ATP-binding protein [Ammoniphilus oxalaticus]